MTLQHDDAGAYDAGPYDTETSDLMMGVSICRNCYWYAMERFF